MEFKALVLIFIGAAFVNNFVLSRFLGLCPHIGVSKQTRPAFGMGMAVIFVMTMASGATWLVHRHILSPFNIEFLRTVVFILVIASFVQLVQILIQKFSPARYNALGIYLPLIATNCAVLGVAVLNSSMFFPKDSSLNTVSLKASYRVSVRGRGSQ